MPRVGIPSRQGLVSHGPTANDQKRGGRTGVVRMDTSTKADWWRLWMTAVRSTTTKSLW